MLAIDRERPVREAAFELVYSVGREVRRRCRRHPLITGGMAGALGAAPAWWHPLVGFLQHLLVALS